MSDDGKFTIPFETCWVIRSTHGDAVRYFEAANIWNKSPAEATIFRSEAAAINEVFNYKKLLCGGLPGEILDAVPLKGALLDPRYGTHIEVKR